LNGPRFDFLASGTTAVNARIAKSVGIELPPAFPAHADEVIE
jgi:hypothetical protein